MLIDGCSGSGYTFLTWRKFMPKRMLIAFVLILSMAAAAEAQYTTLQGWVIIPGKNHPDNFEVRITLKDAMDAIASTNVSDTGRYMFTNLDLSVGTYDIYINIDGYRESRTTIGNVIGVRILNDSNLGANIILIPDPQSRRQADKQEAYNASLINEYSQGLAQITAKHPELAVTHLEKVANEVPDFYDVHMNLGFVYQDLSRPRQAEKEFLKAHDLNGESARPLLALGRLHFHEVELAIEEKETQEALRPKLVQAREELTQALMIDPNLATAFYYLGAVDYRTHSYADAESESKHALELDPLLFEARILRINLFMEQKQWQAALDNADTFILDYPDSALRGEVVERRKRIITRLDRK
jgi:tetratricopeptide (TPR) repeat protein